MQHNTRWQLLILLAILIFHGPIDAQYTNQKVVGKKKSASITFKLDPNSRQRVLGAKVRVYGPPYRVTGDEWIANQWSWLMWWETNWHHYLKPNRTDDSQAPVEVDDAISLAQSTLQQILKTSQNPKQIQLAAYSLARMRGKETSELLIKLLEHQDEDVVRAAWLGLGIMDDELARHALKSVLHQTDDKQQSLDAPKINTSNEPAPQEIDQLSLPQLQLTLTPKTVSAWILAVGLSNHADESLLRSMVPFVAQNHAQINQHTGLQLNIKQSHPLTSLAMWAIRMHKPRDVRILCGMVLQKSTDIALIDEAIQTLATMPRDQDVYGIFARLYHKKRTEWHDFANALMDINPIAYQRTFADGSLPWITLQASAATAFGNPAIAADARMSLLSRRALARTYTWVMPRFPNPADPVVLYCYDDWRNYGKPSKNNGVRQGIIALGKIGDSYLKANQEPKDGQLLTEILRGDYTDRMDMRCEKLPWKLFASEHDPSRGFAAIAIGLYLRRLPADSHQIENAQQAKLARRMERRLVEIASNTEEPTHLRSACLLALGLSNTITAPQSIRSVESPDSMMASYATQALAMLNDPYTFELAHQAFEEKADTLDVEKRKTDALTQDYHIKAIIMQRNIIRALACMANPQANQLLMPRLLENAYT
ncbi:MAG: HEAT repeat domain-containing protein, partial [Phycisphaeraceae bacterium JB051]